MNTVLNVNEVQEVLKIKSFKIKNCDDITSQLRFKIKKNKAGIQKIVVEGKKDGISNLANDLENDWVVLAKLFFNMQDGNIKYGEETFKVKVYKMFKCSVLLEQYEHLKCNYDILKAMDELNISNNTDRIKDESSLDTLKLADIFNAIDVVLEKPRQKTEIKEAETDKKETESDKKEADKKEVDSKEINYKSLGFSDTNDTDCGYDVINRKRWEQLNGHSSNSGKVL